MSRAQLLNGNEGKLKIAIVHDWLATHGGAENVLSDLVACYPEADVFTLFNTMSPFDLAAIGVVDPRVSFLQRFPFLRKNYRNYLPFMPAAIESFDFSGYDLIISSSHAVAKGVVVPPGVLHVCYIHSPPRYIWDLRAQYFRQAGFGIFKSVFAGVLLSALRAWDVSACAGVAMFVANSTYVSKRVMSCYGRESEVVFPPVDSDFFVPGRCVRGDFYLSGGRFVPYKRFDLLIESFRATPERNLVIFGDGPDSKMLRKSAPPNVRFLGRISRTEVRDLMQQCSAFIYAAEEDFGIVMLEALAAGAPVIAYGRGGAVDIIPAPDCEVGMLFARQDVASVLGVLEVFESRRDFYKSQACRNRALLFSRSSFRQRLTGVIDSLLSKRDS